jgi:probable HAF family extracellular repeat protein
MRRIALPHPLDEGHAWDVNEHGQVVGELLIGGYDAPTAQRAFLWSVEDGLTDLGNLGVDDARAIGINDRGDVTGRSVTPTGAREAFLWTRRHGMKGIGSLGGTFSLGGSVNIHRVVVGVSTDAGDQHFVPFYWTAELGMRALPFRGIGGVEGEAEYINDRNEIAGSVFLPDGTTLAVLWRPRVDLSKASVAEKDELFDVIEQSGARSQGASGCGVGKPIWRDEKMRRSLRVGLPLEAKPCAPTR